MRTPFALGILLLLAAEILPAQSAYLPKGRNEEVIRHTWYTLSYSEKDEQAEWVYYVLKPSMITGEAERDDKFRADPRVPSGSATLTDYQGSGYDRGHLCPAADMSFSPDAMSETFYLSNMSPQLPSFNRGIWKRLEEQVRNWARSADSICIVTGGVLTRPAGAIGPSKVTVPACYYKIIFDPGKNNPRMLAFLLPNAKSSEPLAVFAVTTDSVESLTGIDFFPGLPDQLESVLESGCKPEFWFRAPGS
jgi:endonuclease G